MKRAGLRSIRRAALGSARASDRQGLRWCATGRIRTTNNARYPPLDEGALITRSEANAVVFFLVV
jgi:hypothetical protein